MGQVRKKLTTPEVERQRKRAEFDKEQEKHVQVAPPRYLLLRHLHLQSTPKTQARLAIQTAQNHRQRQEKSRAALWRGDSESTRLDDCSHCSTEEAPSTYRKFLISFYPKWLISSHWVLCFDTSLARGNGGSPMRRSPILRRSAWAIRATAAGIGGFPLLTVLIYVANEYPAFEASTR